MSNRKQLGRFPVNCLKRVEQPTTRITDNIQRFDVREHGFFRAMRGDFGPSVKAEFLRFNYKYPLVAALQDMTTFLAPKAVGDIAPSKAPIPTDPEALSRHVKMLGYFLGADMVGICRLPQWAVYSNDTSGNAIELTHKFAIVMLIDQGYETFSGSTGNDWIGSSLSFRAYATEGLISINMANYIRRLGYPARAHHGPYNYQVAMPPLVLLAGLGEVSRTGVVLNPFLGLRFKACAVTTDLPLTPDKPIDFGLQKFCQYCKKCARECPPNAISVGDKVMYNGYETWKLKVERCSIYRITNRKGSACSRCIKVCPWNKPQGWTHDVTRWMVRHSPFLDRFVIKMDDVWGYGKQKIEDKWWFDLEEIDGILRVAGHSGKPE